MPYAFILSNRRAFQYLVCLDLHSCLQCALHRFGNHRFPWNTPSLQPLDKCRLHCHSILLWLCLYSIIPSPNAQHIQPTFPCQCHLHAPLSLDASIPQWAWLCMYGLSRRIRGWRWAVTEVLTDVPVQFVLHVNSVCTIRVFCTSNKLQVWAIDCATSVSGISGLITLARKLFLPPLSPPFLLTSIFPLIKSAFPTYRRFLMFRMWVLQSSPFCLFALKHSTNAVSFLGHDYTLFHPSGSTISNPLRHYACSPLSIVFGHLYTATHWVIDRLAGHVLGAVVGAVTDIPMHFVLYENLVWTVRGFGASGAGR